MSENQENRLALVSLLITPDIQRNLSAIADAVAEAYAEGCRLVCFPECALTGLVDTEDYEADIKLAVDIPGNIADEIGSLAKRYGIYIAIGLLERDQEKLYDTAVLFDGDGDIILKYRRINPKWHSPNAPKNLYVEGASFGVASTLLGKIAFAICGDMFDDTVVTMIQTTEPDYLIVPLARSSADYTQDWWEAEEKWVYAQQIANIGTVSFIINSFESQARWPSFGGALVVSSHGQIIAETRIGEPSLLVCDFPACV